MDSQELVLTTKDNPYNPKTDYDQWKQWDSDNGYDTEEYLARMLDIDGETFDVDDEMKLNELTDKAVQSILEHDILGVYMLV